MNTLKDFDALPDSALVRFPTFQKLVPLSRASIWRGVKNGTLPAPVKLPGQKCIAWRVGDIRRLLADIAQGA